MTDRLNDMDIIKLAQGNIGALNTLTLLLERRWFSEIEKLKRLNIVGTDIYVLWSDICDRDIVTLSILISSTEDSKLVDAASRQDYSGKELLKDELAAAKPTQQENEE